MGEPVLAKGLENLLRQLELITKGASPDVVLLDLTPDVTFALLSELKRSAKDVRIVLWVKSVSPLAFTAMGLGVRGILRKQLPPEIQVKCLQSVHAGELWFEKAPTDSFLNARRDTLTPREAELVSLLAEGFNEQGDRRQAQGNRGYPAGSPGPALVKDRFELALYGLKNLSIGQSPRRAEAPRKVKPAVRGLRSLLLRSEAS